MSLRKLLLEEFVPTKELEEMDKLFENSEELNVYKLLIQKAEDKFEDVGGHGSSRKVYHYNDDKVVKLAKNAKGIAQNTKECDIGTDRMYENILSKVHYCASNNVFLISEYAGVLERDEKFESVTGVPWISYLIFLSWVDMRLNNKLGLYLDTSFSGNETLEQTFKYMAKNRSDKNIDENDYKLIENSDFCQEIEQFIADYNMDQLGDFYRMDSYGVARREGGDQIVIIDYGIDSKIWEEFYL